MNQEVGQRRLAAQDLLQNYLGTWELEPVDFAGIAVEPPDFAKPVGGDLVQVPRVDEPEPVEGWGGVVGGPGDPRDPRTWADHPTAGQRGVPEGARVVPANHIYEGCYMIQSQDGTQIFTCPSNHATPGRHELRPF